MVPHRRAGSSRDVRHCGAVPRRRAARRVSGVDAGPAAAAQARPVRAADRHGGRAALSIPPGGERTARPGTGGAMKKNARLFGSAALLAMLAWRVDLALVARTLAGVRWSCWLAAVLCYAVAQGLSSVRWQALALPLGFRWPLREYISLYFIGTFFNLLLPTSVGGDVARAWYLDAGTGKRWPAFLSVLADRLVGLFVLLVLAFVTALVVP